MSGSEMHSVDPDGDTLLILQHSYAQFAVCDTDERWTNALPQHQSSYSKQQETSILSSEHAECGDGVLSGTLSLVKDEPEPKHTRYKLCSHVLRRTCSYFSRLMSSKWQEAELEEGFQWTIKATDWDEEAVTILMNILHHRTRGVPRTISLEMLANIAVLVDYYGCHEAAELWVEIWMAKLGPVAPEYYSRDLLLRLTVATVFSDNESFNILTKIAIRRSRGPIHTLGLPISQQIVDAIENKRQEVIAQLCKDLQSIWDDVSVSVPYKVLCCSLLEDQILKDWVGLAMIDENLLESAIFLSASQELLCACPDNPVLKKMTLEYRQKSLCTLRKALSSSEQVFSLVNIAQALALAFDEEAVGRKEIAKKHLEGTFAMVEIAGGLQSLGITGLLEEIYTRCVTRAIGCQN
ncbi:hypothetical protein DER45DRAFT_636229 [Fusarium avenaceum]|nr:hypothetical protein DER45DRAFT_636229 [Fusarium avenaceum]